MRTNNTRFGWIVRILLVVVAYGAALIAFRMGVGVSDRVSLAHAGLLTHAYYALGLFVLGGLDLGVPVGGTQAGRALLWFAYFLAPSITTSALIESALRIIRPTLLRRAPHERSHRHRRDWAARNDVPRNAARTSTARARVVAVDADANKATLDVAENQLETINVIGDLRNNATLAALNLHKARFVVLVTDDDLVNLEVAYKVAELAPDASVVAHVADMGMRRMLARTEPGRRTRFEVFNAHRIAAQRLYEEHLRAYFAETTEDDVVVLAGFGRFGQTILEYLQDEARGEIRKVVVVDSAASRLVKLFRVQVPGFDDDVLEAIDGDLQDLEILGKIENAGGDDCVCPVFVLGTDDEGVNLRVAIALRTLRPDAKIFVRCVYASTFIAELAAEQDFEVLAVETMLRRALQQRHEAWLRR